jgi:M6 family metalloprotease-like protein/uncharacterized repeat protein (TIGR01451 family)
VRALLGALLALASVPTLQAMQRPTAAERARYVQDGTAGERLGMARSLGNHRVASRLVQRSTHRLQQEQWRKGLRAELPTPPPAWIGMPTTGTVRVFALLIDFAEYPHAPANSNEAIHTKLFGDGSGGHPYESLRKFYQRSSYGQLDIEGSTLGWHTTSYPRSAVPPSLAGREALIREAIAAHDAAGHDFSQYDNDGDGAIDYFLVFWTGPDAGWGSFWWGYQTTYWLESFTVDGKRLGTYSWQWESRPEGGTFSPLVAVHETGHALGLPDYYDYDDSPYGPSGGVGGLDMMDANWGDHNCFSKFLLDWIRPTVLAGGLNPVSLRPSGTHGDAVLFARGAAGSPFAEYFAVQNRARVGNDADHPGEGLLVWHVDATLDPGGADYLWDNSFTTHKLLRLMEADGKDEIEALRRADEGDYYGPGRSIGPTTHPSTERYDGVPNPMRLTGITAAADHLEAQVEEVVDPTPPTGAPGRPLGPGLVSALTRLPYAWTAGSAADADGGIAGYEFQIGTSVGMDVLPQDFHPRRIVGDALAFRIWAQGRSVRYYGRVRALNAAGLASAWSPASGGTALVPADFDCSVLDNCLLGFKTIGADTWSVDGSTSVLGGTAARSPALADDESSALEVNVVGPGTLRFWWRVSSESGADTLTLSSTQVPAIRISGEVPWTQQTVDVPAGLHRLSWMYSKGEAGRGGDDAAWVDRVEWTGGAGAAVRGVSPAAGPVGTAVTITGVGLGEAWLVGFGGVFAPATAASATTVLTTVPAGAASGPLVVSAGLSAAAAAPFMVTSLPLVSISDASTGEGDSGGVTARFAVELSAPAAQEIAVTFTTVDGTARAGEDYLPLRGTISFSPGTTRQLIEVPVYGDTRHEPEETLLVVLGFATGAEVVDGNAVGRIKDDDPPQVVLGTRAMALGEGPFQPGSRVSYRVELSNAGNGRQADNPGAELVDALPAQLTPVAATATTGVASILGRTVTWNGSLEPGDAVAITVETTVDPTATAGSRISNQARINFDRDGDGTNDSVSLTDDPAQAGEHDATAFVLVDRPESFFALAPCRLVDTRNPAGPRGGPGLYGGGIRTFRLVGACGVPTTARALAINLTVTGATAPGHVTLFPGGSPCPLASTANFGAGATRANSAILQLGSQGDLSAVASSFVQIVLDVTGYFEPSSP